jgi:hypothetical protein
MDATETVRMARLAQLIYAMPLLLHVGQANVVSEIRNWRTMAAWQKRKLIHHGLVERCVGSSSVPSEKAGLTELETDLQMARTER